MDGPGTRWSSASTSTATRPTRWCCWCGGAAASYDCWDVGLCRAIADGGRHVVRYDHRDTGRSTTGTPGSPSYDGNALERDCAALVEALGAPAHLVGLSMGGGIAQSLALPAARAGRVPHPGRDGRRRGGRPRGAAGADGRARRWFADPPPDPDWTDREAVVAWSLAAERVFAGPGFDEPRARAAAGAMFDRSHDPAAAGNHWLVAGDDEPEPLDVHRIAVPTLVVHGAQDPMFPLPHAEALAAAVPGARLLVVDGMGHQVPPPAAWPDVVAGHARGSGGAWPVSPRCAGGHQREHATHAGDGEPGREAPDRGDDADHDGAERRPAVEADVPHRAGLVDPAGAGPLERRDQGEVLQRAVAGPAEQRAGQQPAGGPVAGAPGAGRGPGGRHDEQRGQPRRGRRADRRRRGGRRRSATRRPRRPISSSASPAVPEEVTWGRKVSSAPPAIVAASSTAVGGTTAASSPRGAGAAAGSVTRRRRSRHGGRAPVPARDGPGGRGRAPPGCRAAAAPPRAAPARTRRRRPRVRPPAAAPGWVRRPPARTPPPSGPGARAGPGDRPPRCRSR